MFNNICTPINLVNRTRYQAINIVLIKNNIFNFW